MLATLMAVSNDRDTKADPATAGRRNQAREVLADTGIRVAENEPLIFADLR